MTDLSRNLLAAARDGMTPDADVMARVRAKVAAATSAAATGGMAAIPAKAATGFTAKLAIGALVVAAVTAGVVVAVSGSSRSAPGAASLAPRASDNDTPASMHSTAGARELPAPPAHDQPRVVKDDISLAREVELIDRAVQLVRGTDYRGALAQIAIFDRESHGRGQMAEEAAAIDIEARCRLHQSVGERLTQFDRSWPSSAQRSRLQSICF